MRDKSANVAVQIPALTANNMRRCKICAVLVGRHSAMLSQRHERRASTCLVHPAAIRLRTSKKVKKTAIRISTPAATARDEVAIACPSDARDQIVGSEHETYFYREETITEHNELDSVYAGGE